MMPSQQPAQIGPKFPRRLVRREECFGVTCSDCNQAVEIPTANMIGLRAGCRCGAKLEIQWPIHPPRTGGKCTAAK